jgi:hypothetical protein
MECRAACEAGSGCRREQSSGNKTVAVFPYRRIKDNAFYTSKKIPDTSHVLMPEKNVENWQNRADVNSFEREPPAAFGGRSSWNGFAGG